MTPGSDLATMRAAYLRADRVRRWSRDELARALDRLAAAGLDTVITKLQAVDPALRDACRDRDLRVMGSFACYSDHGSTNRVAEHLRPVDDRGRRWAPMEWYWGVIPTDEAYNDGLAAELTAAMERAPVDGVMFDFLRWPCHWELELRPDAPRRQASFDPTTLTRFSSYLDGVGHDGKLIDATDPVSSAELIVTSFAAEWTDFRCGVVESTCRRLAAIATRYARRTGLFVVPAAHDVRREVVGQDTGRLGAIIDVLMPMTYHAIVNRPPSWPATVVADIQATTPAATVPMVQAPGDAPPGCDWGHRFDAEEFRAVLRAVHSARGSASGFGVFPGDELAPAALDAITTTSVRTTDANTLLPTDDVRET